MQHYVAAAQLAAAEKLRAATVEKLRAAADDGDDGGSQSGRRDEEEVLDDEEVLGGRSAGDEGGSGDPFLYKRRGPAHSVRWPECSQYKGVSRESARGKWWVTLDCNRSGPFDTELD